MVEDVDVKIISNRSLNKSDELTSKYEYEENTKEEEKMYIEEEDELLAESSPSQGSPTSPDLSTFSPALNLNLKRKMTLSQKIVKKSATILVAKLQEGGYSYKKNDRNLGIKRILKDAKGHYKQIEDNVELFLDTQIFRGFQDRQIQYQIEKCAIRVRNAEFMQIVAALLRGFQFIVYSFLSLPFGFEQRIAYGVDCFTWIILFMLGIMLYYITFEKTHQATLKCIFLHSILFGLIVILNILSIALLIYENNLTGDTYTNYIYGILAGYMIIGLFAYNSAIVFDYYKISKEMTRIGGTSFKATSTFASFYYGARNLDAEMVMENRRIKRKSVQHVQMFYGG